MTQNKQERLTEICQKAQQFCLEELKSEEYAQLAEKLFNKLKRKRSNPLERGRSEIWAAAIVHALGSVNFLFDKSFRPYCTVANINDYFGTKATTVTNKSTQIKDLLRIRPMDNEFMTQHMQENSPLNMLKNLYGNNPLEMLQKLVGEAVENDDLPDIEIPAIDQSAIRVIPKQPFWNWIQAQGVSLPFDPKDFNDFNTYLIPDLKFEMPLEDFLPQRFQQIWQLELAAFLPKCKNWPQKMEMFTFNQWFEVRPSSFVMDLTGNLEVEDSEDWEDPFDVEENENLQLGFDF